MARATLVALLLLSCGGNDVPTGPAAGTTRSFELPGGATMSFVWIEPGTFTMGSSPLEIRELQATYPRKGFDPTSEGPQHQVTIAEGFWLGTCEVTQGQWQSVMRTTPWSGRFGVQDDPQHPAACISWDDAQEFVDRLNEEAGAAVYRLPTEAEWEYACRAGTTTRWSYGDDVAQLGNYAWYEQNTWRAGMHYAQPVGTKLANPWGLHDMHGNVSEWCQDWYFDSPSAPGGPTRVIRGGHWTYPELTRSAWRTGWAQSDRAYHIGARLVRSE